jgi:hypothetical protein
LEFIATSNAKEVELKEEEVELKILSKENLRMTADLTTMPPARRAWFERGKRRS